MQHDTKDPAHVRKRQPLASVDNHMDRHMEPAPCRALAELHAVKGDRAGEQPAAENMFAFFETHLAATSYQKLLICSLPLQSMHSAPHEGQRH